MPDETRKYPTANGAPQEPQFFCPFGSIYQSGPAGSWIKKLPPCDPKHCAVAHPGMDVCSILQISNTLSDIFSAGVSIEHMLKHIATLLEHHNERLEAILQKLSQAKIE